MAYFTYHHDDRAEQNSGAAHWAASIGLVVRQCLAFCLCVALIPLAVLALPFTLLGGANIKSGEYWN